MSTTVIDKPGFYRMPPALYHSDPCVEPALSSSVCRAMVKFSAAHGRLKHPRLAKQPPKDPSIVRDIGSAVHQITFAAGADLCVIHGFDDYRKKDAQRARADAYAAGEIPLLEEHHNRAQAASAIARTRILELAGAEAQFETAMFWREGEDWARTQVDAMSKDGAVVIDLKTTDSTARDEDCDNRINGDDLDVQAAFIIRGLDTLQPAMRGRRKFFFVFIEQNEPFGVNHIELSEDSLQLARKMVRAGVNMWGKAIATKEWASYARTSRRSSVKPWRETAWLDREMSDPTINIEEAA